ncbi:NAD(P)-dependent oxidoreductase [Rhodococcus fascians]|nr:NAD(P)-dependent oxidoreductase [Rhodococcus fascians]MBY4140926.1 NAD(P)-dependent oxidoreductase [Rhodococcus fascians]MBY4219590.1 NAD(P)-dependent oxidoreductase [Rhodococcus fascians]MBY4221899.1 NAD(P)-dependent oxidoreductase [Rhodococcus fascians]MBY4233900.1 NAD(P)-dependent oxidoreductase [Rhodococcus fascians]
MNDAATTAEVASRADAERGRPRIGFIGLGSQGGPMARRIIESGYSTTLYARRNATLEPFLGSGVDCATSPAALGRVSDLVCLCVVDDSGLESVVLGDDGVLAGMAPGSAIAIHSTVRPETCRRLAEAAAKVGVEVIDAPVSGGGPGAEAGTLLVMTGGDEATVDRFRPVFASYADSVVHLGPLGAGQNTKLLNNTLFTANLATAAGIFSAGSDLGVDPKNLSTVLARGSGASFAAAVVGASRGDLSAMSSTAGPLLRKDVEILVEVLGGNESLRGAVWALVDSALTDMAHPRAIENSE